MFIELTRLRPHGRPLDRSQRRNPRLQTGLFTLVPRSSYHSMDKQSIIETLRRRVPGLLGIYAFGSRVNGQAESHSDLDLAVLVEGYAEPVALWQLAGDLAGTVGCDVDLLDLRRASTVMQHQVLTRGERWWASDVRAGLFECAVLGEKLELDRARAGLLSDIRREGRIHGR
ncbi:nucleotidyltransferase domain-containing protein [Luteimonas sp. TWI662]|uniref:type VII toxin-antitoxin system MntA family adenylyltransferase antitoxin n=1 Tax=unclassified Luteimonas TaxID=2629088 RepID=UPI00320B8B42